MHKINCSQLLKLIAYRWSQLRLWRDRWLAQGNWWWNLVVIILVCAFFTAVVGLILWGAYHAFFLSGFYNSPDYANNSFSPHNIFDAAYYLMFTNGGQNLYEGNHWVGIAITTLGIILIAALTSVITNLRERRAQRYLNGESTYLLKDHIVIFGANDYLYSIIKEKTNNNKSKIASVPRFLIVTTQDVASIRREVFSFLDQNVKRNQFVFKFGNRTSEEDVSKLSLEWAKEVYIIGDREESDDIESYRDANNMDCVVAIGKYLGNLASDKDTNILPCHVMFEYQTSFAAFQFSEIPAEAKEHIDFKPFNYYDLWARKVIVAGHAGNRKYQFLDRIPSSTEIRYISKDSEETVHLIILGMTKMGVAMALQAAHVCHYPNFRSDQDPGIGRKRTRITFIDSDVDIERNYFKGRFPCMMADTRTRYMDFMQDDYLKWREDKEANWIGDEKGWYDVEWEFIKGRIESNEVQVYLSESAADKRHIVSIAVCLPKSHQSIAAAMYMPNNVYTDCLQILAYQRRSGTIIDYLAKTPVHEGEVAKYRKIVPFGMVDEGYDSFLDDDYRAMMVSCVYDNSDKITEDKILNSIFWEELFVSYLSSWREKFVMEKMSSFYCANSIMIKLRGIGIYDERQCPLSFSQEDLEILERVEHNRWNIEKMLTGFRSLTQDEVDEMYKIDKTEWEKKRKAYKKWPERAHLDICSFEELKRRDAQAIIDLDKYFSIAIPYMLNKSEIEKE